MNEARPMMEGEFDDDFEAKLEQMAINPSKEE